MAPNKTFSGKNKEIDESIVGVLSEKDSTVFEIVKKTGYPSMSISSRMTHLKGTGVVLKKGTVIRDEQRHRATLWGLK